MKRKGFKSDGLIGIFFLACGLFSYPILTVFNIQTTLFGLPLLFMYIFAVWFAIIVLIYSFTRSQARTKVSESPDSFLAPHSTD